MEFEHFRFYHFGFFHDAEIPGLVEFLRKSAYFICKEGTHDIAQSRFSQTHKIGNNGNIGIRDFTKWERKRM